tara:strand:+ start:917 stop:1477 length:561 start_codon:yes stop_codon:yes gene_type:complete
MKTLLTTLTSLLLSATMSFAALDFTSGFSIDSAYDTVGSTVDPDGIAFSTTIGVLGGTISGFWNAPQDASDFSSQALAAIGAMSSAPSLNYTLTFYDSSFAFTTVSVANWANVLSDVPPALGTSGTADSLFAWTDVNAIDINISAGGDVALAGTLTGIAAVPEPSTYALLAGFAAFIFVAIRRRNS